MNMTKNGENDRKIDNNEHKHGELDRNHNKYYHNDEPIRVNMTKSGNYKNYIIYSVKLTSLPKTP